MRRWCVVIFCSLLVHCGERNTKTIPTLPAAGSLVGEPEQVVSTIVEKYQTSAVFEYQATCEDHFTSPFRLIEPSAKVKSALNELRTTFTAVPSIQITQNEEGNFDIIDRSISTGLINVKIRHLSFNNELSSDDAIAELFGTNEVRSFIREHNINFATNIGGGLRPIPNKRSPRMSGTFENITVSDALDKIVRSFPGLLVYKQCVSGNKTWISVYLYPRLRRGLDPKLGE